ncbi:hypothetical protein ACUXCC_002328 [Cytobacillus horneckiae]|uniref:hypothetical protein n=1 Tax=Cytobacillus horneckiae TaxID=549687 RepID=UPI001562A702|nr:hypothetical protein [Cytobacillus horneckiae]MBN6888317.1 hypothetical protein [Cytobacillus horneckiae]MCM3181224.1 hypothetical protein [Cytobacillus horneckiae]NRG44472.1 hypothetical protein [Bacillus sp. CRN 9]
MDSEKYKRLYKRLLIDFEFDGNTEISLNSFRPIIENIKKDSSIFLFKVDGEREENCYSFIITGEKLGQGNFLRMETSDLEGGLSYICVKYAEEVWGWNSKT